MKKTKFFIIAVLCCACVFAPAFAKDIVYISPNNDGAQDELVIPLRIKDARYISEWKLEIFDEDGIKANPPLPIKTIGNKDKRDESALAYFKSLVAGDGAKDFFKKIGSSFAPRKGVSIPPEIRWNCYLDSGEIIKDGTYFYYLTARDDNGNEARTKTYTFVVDSHIPEINVTQPQDALKVFGAGSRPNITIKQNGSKEDLWLATITSSSGKVVRTYKWENETPSTVVWDGQNDDGFFVEQGVYNYQISCTDRAGNKSKPALVTNIIYDAVPRSVSMFIDGSPFSPGTESKKQFLTIDLDVPNQAGLTNWKIDIKKSVSPLATKRERDAALTKTRSIVGDTNVPPQIKFDGKDDNGVIFADGDYEITFTAIFNNGQEPKKTLKFGIDTVAPKAQITCSDTILSPDGDGNKDTVVFSEIASKESAWHARIVDESGNFVKTWEFKGFSPETIVWNGFKDDGKIAKDGYYYYEIAAIDEAGNSSVNRMEGTLQLDTSKAEAMLLCEFDAFSPTGDGNRDTIAIVPIIKATSGIDFYYFCIESGEDNIVWTKAAKGNVPNSFEWDGRDSEGRRCPDGKYYSRLQIVSLNGGETWAQSQSFELMRSFPIVKNFTGDNMIFSPNGDSRKDNIKFVMDTSVETLWQLDILDKAGKVVKSEIWQNTSPKEFVWDGTDSNGNVVKDGNYSALLYSQNIATNKTTAKIDGIVVDTRPVKAYITSSQDAFSPLATNEKNVEVFSLIANPNDNIESWKVSVLDQFGRAVRTWSTQDSADLPEKITWDGQVDKSAQIADNIFANGNYIAKLDLTYLKGDVVSATSTNFVCASTAPEAKVMTSPRFFSPDNDGVEDELYIKLKYTDILPVENWTFVIQDPKNPEIKFWDAHGKSTITERLMWNGRSSSGELVQSATDYPYEFTVTNSVGIQTKATGVIPIDVLVIRVGDVLKIQIPSIIFRANKADFLGKDQDPQKGLDKDTIANNERVLRRIAEILNKFKDYNVVIEGHANNVTGTEEEEIEELVPLSKERAEFVKTRIARYGVNPARMTTEGKGGREPVSDTQNQAVNWKNRRVEFILMK